LPGSAGESIENYVDEAGGNQPPLSKAEPAQLDNKIDRVTHTFELKKD